MVDYKIIPITKNTNQLYKARRQHYLIECANRIKQDKSLRFPNSTSQKLTYAEAEQLRAIYRDWTRAYINCETYTPPNSSELGRRYGIDGTTTYRILNNMRYFEDNDITYDSLKFLGYIED